MARSALAKRNGIARLTILLALLSLALLGCGGSTEDEGSLFVGTWILYEGTTATGTPAWYIHFQENLTFTMSTTPDGSNAIISGTYTEAGTALVGPFTNPGVGTGRVEATISGNTMHLDFIEYWHIPNKIIGYTGVRR